MVEAWQIAFSPLAGIQNELLEISRSFHGNHNALRLRGIRPHPCSPVAGPVLVAPQGPRGAISGALEHHQPRVPISTLGQTMLSEYGSNGCETCPTPPRGLCLAVERSRSCVCRAPVAYKSSGSCANRSSQTTFRVASRGRQPCCGRIRCWSQNGSSQDCHSNGLLPSDLGFSPYIASGCVETIPEMNPVKLP